MYATIVPVFAWLLMGLLSSTCIIHHRRARQILIIIWLLAAFSLGDHPQNLLRQFLPVDSEWSAARRSDAQATDRIPVRIVSLNCMNESSAIGDLSFLNPDVVLLQESVSKKEMNRVLETHFMGYSMAWSSDATILVRGEIESLEVASNLKPRYQFSRVTLENGAQFHALSLHLIHSPRRADFWNPETWRVFADLRKTRRRQLLEIRAEIGEAIGTSPAIMGGDFNAPAGDPIFEMLQPRFEDSWGEAGRGWGKTSLNKFPIHRIDQVWVTEQFDGVNVTSKKSKGSDHRAVICDLFLRTGS